MKIRASVAVAMGFAALLRAPVACSDQARATMIVSVVVEDSCSIALDTPATVRAACSAGGGVSMAPDGRVSALAQGRMLVRTTTALTAAPPGGRGYLKVVTVAF